MRSLGFGVALLLSGCKGWLMLPLPWEEWEVAAPATGTETATATHTVADTKPAPTPTQTATPQTATPTPTVTGQPTQTAPAVTQRPAHAEASTIRLAKFPQITAIAADKDEAFATDGQTIWGVSVGGGPVRTVARWAERSGQTADELNLVMDAQYIYGIRAAEKRLIRVSRRGGTPETLCTTAREPQALQMVGSHILWSEGDTDPELWTLRNGNPVRLYAGSDGPTWPLIQGGGRIWWFHGTTVFWLDPDATDPQVLQQDVSEQANTALPGHIVGMAADSEGFYVSTFSQTGSYIWGFSTQPYTPPTLLATLGSDVPLHMVSTPEYLWWSVTAPLNRVAKKNPQRVETIRNDGMAGHLPMLYLGSSLLWSAHTSQGDVLVRSNL